MALPSTTNDLASNSVHCNDSAVRFDEWPSLPASQSSKRNSEPAAAKVVKSAMNTPEREGFQISKEPYYGKTDGPSGSTQNQGPEAGRIMIVNDSKKAWFYPSKGLNELFYRAGKVATSNTKVATSKSPNPIPKPPKATPVNSQRRHSYVEVLKMAFGGDNRKG
jgi:hypothetical protein